MKSINLLPYEGEVIYFGTVISKSISDKYFINLLQDINWQPEKIKMFGKCITTKRKTAFYGDASISYQYSQSTKVAEPWTSRLIELKALVEKLSLNKFNSCLLNLYHDGTEKMGWHRDNEKDLVVNGTIASLSFGAKRKFQFRHIKTKEMVSIDLAHGSLLLMKGTTQQYWHHQLPLDRTVNDKRINLTFRRIMF